MSKEYQINKIIESTTSWQDQFQNGTNSGDSQDNVKDNLLTVLDIINKQNDEIEIQNIEPFQEFSHNGEDKIIYNKQKHVEIKLQMQQIANNTTQLDDTYQFDLQINEENLNLQTMNTIINNQNQIRIGIVNRRCSCDEVTRTTSNTYSGSCYSYSHWVNGQPGVSQTTCFSVRACNCNSDYLFPCYCNRVYYGNRRYFYVYRSTYNFCDCQNSVCGCDTYYSGNVCDCEGVCTCDRQITNCQQDCSCDIQRRF